MSRKNKFRAWDTKRKVMLYPPGEFDSMIAVRQGSPDGPHLDIGGNSFPAVMTWTGLCYIDGSYQELEFLQFTGLLDKNGREIYEGDIVRGTKEDFVSDVIGVVKYVGMAFVFEGTTEKSRYAISGGGDDNNFWFYTITNPSIRQLPEIEVIGNIWENPELLGE